MIKVKREQVEREGKMETRVLISIEVKSKVDE